MEIIVVARTDDAATQAVVAELQHGTELLSLATVERPGVLAAMETGVRRSRGDVVAFTDDDARPYPDWIARLLAAFGQDTGIAGVGGRDNFPDDARAGKDAVGRLGWFGRVTGNHHLGVGPPRPVAVLKGVNCAYRREVLEHVGFDHRLRGRGVELHWELALGLAILRCGGRLIYDPAIMVDHDEGPRVDGQRLNVREAEKSMSDAAYNEALVLSEHLSGPRRLSYVTWSSVVGHRDSPGFVQAVRFTPILGRQSWRRRAAAARARHDARRASGARR